MDDAMNMLQNTKNIVNELVDTLYNAAWTNGLDLERDTLVAELEALTTYLAGADNDISTNEIDLMNYLFDVEITPNAMPGLIKTLGEMYNKMILELQMPGWLLSKAIDSANGDHQVTDIYIGVVKILMQLFAAVDGETDSKEERFINDFINRLERDR